MKKILIIGGVAGGATAAARIRRNDEKAHIIVFEKGKHISYANCGLPYYLGKVIPHREQLFVQDVKEFSTRYKLDIRTNNEVIAIDTSKNKIEVYDINKQTTYYERYDKLILSPGAKPIIPKINGVYNEGIFTLRNVTDTDNIKKYIETKKPKKAVIIGAGYIGLELAENISKVCNSVTIIEMSNRVIPILDYEMSGIIEQHIRSQENIELFTNQQVISIEQKEEHRKNVILKDKTKISADIILITVGVAPDTKILQNSNIQLTNNGSIIVNEYLQTNVDNVYAIGDAIIYKHPSIGKSINMYLAGPASKQARIAADNIIYGNINKYKGSKGTSIIKIFDIIAGQTGMSEQVVKKLGIDYIVSHTHNKSHANYYPNAKELSIKLIYSSIDGHIFGAQIVGYDGVDKRLDVVSALTYKNATVYDLIEIDHSYAPPFSSSKDPINIAGMVAQNILEGKVKIIHWHEIIKELKKGAYLIDVRTKEENVNANIQGSNLIPIDELRRRLNEIPLDKKIIIYCRAGHRGYLACRILCQNDYKEVYNLSGGYNTYEATIN